MKTKDDNTGYISVIDLHTPLDNDSYHIDWDLYNVEKHWREKIDKYECEMRERYINDMISSAVEHSIKSQLEISKLKGTVKELSKSKPSFIQRIKNLFKK